MRPVLISLLAVTLVSSVAIAPAIADAAVPSPLTRKAVARSTVRQPHVVTVGTQTLISTDSQYPIAPDPALPSAASAVTVATRFADTALRSPMVAFAVKPTAVTAVGGGDTVVRLQQTVAGVPVMGGETVITLNARRSILSASSERLSSRPISTTAQVPAIRAIAAAKLTVADRAGVGRAALIVSTPQLWIFDPRIVSAPGIGRPIPVWRTEVASAADPAVRWLVLIDALSGKVAMAIDEINDAVNRTVCSNRNQRGLSETCTTARVVRREGSRATGEANADSAYAFAGDTYRFYLTVLGRHGIDNHDLPMRSTVKFCLTADEEAAFHATCPLQNAFWDGTQMVYGDGYASAQDVVAHELTHGVTQYTSNLFYYHQSGAINESLSDIFGEFVDQWSHDATGVVRDTDIARVRWRMGEDLPIGAVRNMADPTLDSRTSVPLHDADRMSSPYFYLGEGDSGGVHSNSGVGNKFAYLLTDGGTFNGVTVRGIGLNRAAQIVYRASQQLTSAADYRAFAAALTQSCQALIGYRLTSYDQVVRLGDCTQVGNAVVAVEMDVRPNLIQSAPLCMPGQTATTVWSDSMEGPHQWVSSTATPAQPSAWYYGATAPPNGFPEPYATTGRNNLWGNDADVRTDASMTMATAVPLPVSPGSSYALRFNHAEGMSVRGGRTVDGGVVEFSTDGGASWNDAGSRLRGVGGYTPYTGTINADIGNDNPLAGRAAFVGHSAGYVASRFDVSDLAGSSIRLRFRIGVKSKETGDPGDYGWYIDDVAIVRCDGVPVLDAPRAISAVSGNALAVVSWTGDTAARAFRVTSIPDGRSCATASTHCVVRGLRNGVAYRFHVRADAAGAPSAAATSVVAVVPSTVPGRPPGLAIRYANAITRSLTMSWGSPGSGGAAIQRYEFCLASSTTIPCTTWHPVSVVGGIPATSQILGGLLRNRQYRVEVRARNFRGPGLPSSASFRQSR